MDNIEIEKFNIYVKQIIYIISFLIIIYIIIDELVRLSRFAFTYKINYDYGNNLSDICGGDNIEYETGRFLTMNSINNYKLSNDVYNKSNYMILLLIIVLIFMFIICYCFGIYFYNTVIEKNKCFSINELEDSNVMKQMTICFLGEKMASSINTCIIYYIILFVIIALIPISILLNVILNFNIYITENFYTPIFLILFISILISRYYVGIDISFLSFTIFLIVFISSLIFYKKIWDIYKNYNFSTDDLYTNNQKNNPNKYNNTGDDKFYTIYSNKIPTEPNLVTTKPTAAISAATATATAQAIIAIPVKEINVQYTQDEMNFYENYIINDTTLPAIKANYNLYIDDKNIYNEKMKKYNEELDFYNKNNIFKNDSDNLTFLNILLTFIGINNPNDISIYILILLGFLVVIVICLFVSYNDLLYNVFIIILNVFIIILLINSITIVNTYINKYFIYKNSNLYKYDINKINNKFSNILDNIKVNGSLNPVEPKIGNIILYNIYSSMFSFNLYRPIGITSSFKTNLPDSSLSYHIGYKRLLGGGNNENFKTTFTHIYKTTSDVSSYYQIIKNFDIYNINSDGDWIKPSGVGVDDNIESVKNGILHYNIIKSVSIEDDNGWIINDILIKYFIKNIFVEDINTIDTIITNLKNNIMVDYCKFYINPIDLTFLRESNASTDDINSVTINPLKVQEIKDRYNEYSSRYKTIVNNCINAYKNFILDMRNIIAELLINKNVILTCSNSKQNIISLPTDFFTNTSVAFTTLWTNIGYDKDKFNKIYRKLVDNLYETLNYNGTVVDDRNTIISDIINNYNSYNEGDSKYNEKLLKELSPNNDNNDNIYNETYSNTLINNMTNVSNSIYVIVLLSIFAILEPIYI
jgi:hypothetical protein